MPFFFFNLEIKEKIKTCFHVEKNPYAFYLLDKLNMIMTVFGALE